VGPCSRKASSWRNASLPRCPVRFTSLHSQRPKIVAGRKRWKLRMTAKASHWTIRPTQSHYPTTGGWRRSTALPHFTLTNLGRGQVKIERFEYLTRREGPFGSIPQVVFLKPRSNRPSCGLICKYHQTSISKALMLPLSNYQI